MEPSMSRVSTRYGLFLATLAVAVLLLAPARGSGATQVKGQNAPSNQTAG
jgi:hypothetical protein